MFAAAESAWAVEGPFPLFSGHSMAAGSPAAPPYNTVETGRQTAALGGQERRGNALLRAQSACRQNGS